MSNWKSLLVHFALALAPSLAYAQEQHSKLHYEGVAEIQLDTLVDTQAGQPQERTLFNTTSVGLGIRLGKGFSLESFSVLEPVSGSAGDQYFAKEGLYAETLLLQYTQADFTLFAGKIDPVYGTAWDIAPGIYGTEFAEEYQLTEKIGFGADVNLGHILGHRGGGEHILSASLYRADTSFLSNSAFTRRGRLSRSDGGVSNTSGLKSVAVALDGSEMPSLPGLSYHAGLRSQAPGLGDAHREKGLVFGLDYTAEPGSGTSLELLAEISHLWHANGAAHEDISVVTLGANVSRGVWHFASVYAGHFSQTGPVPPGMKNSHQIQFSAGRDLPHNLAIDVGWKHTNDNGHKTGTFGILLSYAFSG